MNNIPKCKWDKKHKELKFLKRNSVKVLVTEKMQPIKISI